MGTGPFEDDTVAMSESIGIALLVGMTVVVTAIVGLNVLVVPEDGGGGPPEANFTYDYVEDSELLIVTHNRGDELPAGNIDFRGPGENVTWAEIANRNESSLVGPGDVAQLGSENAYDQSVGGRETIRIYYNESGNRTLLDQWNGAR
jgi:hypothetical protein